ncbi:SDR family NAD(P)-dependent oxidoreductase [Mycobacterium sp. 1245801.1]|uniref:SDR family NAD(P)-dependent oxidoreductase n=1 Tax=Mycobacterium sp. 1245801.1 TaxID=1834075 RepID=UPI003512FA7D
MPIVLITGGSRGVGAATARHLATARAHVIVTYREKKRRATNLVERITAVGGSASSLRLDICEPDACAEVIRCVRDDFGRLDTLILNALGGLERDADPGYAMRINCHAPVHLLIRVSLAWRLPVILATAAWRAPPPDADVTLSADGHCFDGGSMRWKRNRLSQPGAIAGGPADASARSTNTSMSAASSPRPVRWRR